LQFDLIDLELFINIAEANSLTHGAERSHLAVPSASMRIKHVEDRLGTKLFYRTHHGVILTPAGNSFLQHGRLVLEQLERLKGDLQGYAKGVKGNLRVFASTGPITEFLPGVLRTYLKTHPNVRVDLREHLSQDIVRAVSDGTTDIGIVADIVATDGLETIPYRQYRHVLVTSTDHAFAARKLIGFAETLEEDYVGLLEGGVMNTFLRQAANRLNNDLKIRVQVGSFEAVCRMVESGAGIGILPELPARRHAKTMDIRVIELKDEWAVRKLKVCVRSVQSLPLFAKDLVDLLAADCDEKPTGPVRLPVVAQGGRRTKA
jgi:DNA-binding transcriptional LysR family regulator